MDQNQDLIDRLRMRVKLACNDHRYTYESAGLDAPGYDVELDLRAADALEALAGIPDVAAFVARYEAMEKACKKIAASKRFELCDHEWPSDGGGNDLAWEVLEARAALSAPAPTQDVTGKLVEALAEIACWKVQVLGSDRDQLADSIDEIRGFASKALDLYRAGESQ